MQPLLQRLGLESLPLPEAAAGARHATWQDWFVARAEAPVAGAEGPRGEPWWLVVGPNAVLTLHHAPLPFLDELFDRDDPDSQIGVLSADSFAASLLDRMLTAYFDAVDTLEDQVDELEVTILQPRLRGSKLPELRRLRSAVSTLRRMLASQRDLFDALSRPDFRPDHAEDARMGISSRCRRATNARPTRSRMRATC